LVFEIQNATILISEPYGYAVNKCLSCKVSPQLYSLEQRLGKTNISLVRELRLCTN